MVSGGGSEHSKEAWQILAGHGAVVDGHHGGEARDGAV
jgi:hypothetical protein